MSRSVPSASEAQATYAATLFDQWSQLGLKDVVISPGSRSTPLALAASPKGDVVFSGDHLGVGILWDFATGREIRRFEGHHSSISAAVISADGTRVITGEAFALLHHEQIPAGAFSFGALNEGRAGAPQRQASYGLVDRKTDAAKSPSQISAQVEES